MSLSLRLIALFAGLSFFGCSRSNPDAGGTDGGGGGVGGNGIPDMATASTGSTVFCNSGEPDTIPFTSSAGSANVRW